MLTERPMTQGKELVKTSNLIDRALIQVGARHQIIVSHWQKKPLDPPSQFFLPAFTAEDFDDNKNAFKNIY